LKYKDKAPTNNYLYVQEIKDIQENASINISSQACSQKRVSSKGCTYSIGMLSMAHENHSRPNKILLPRGYTTS
jgi:hypothetical protein